MSKSIFTEKYRPISSKEVIVYWITNQLHRAKELGLHPEIETRMKILKPKVKSQNQTLYRLSFQNMILLYTNSK